MDTNDKNPLWETTKKQNLIRYKPSGTYFARFKVGGKLVRKTLKTSVFHVAKLRLADKIKEHRTVADSRKRFRNGKMAVGDAIRIYEDQLDLNPDLKPRSKQYYRLLLDFIMKSWPGLVDSDSRKISEGDCKRWLVKFRRRYAPSVTNNAIAVLRAIFSETVEAGARFSNPAVALKRVRVRGKKLQLPSRDEFLKFVDVIASGGCRHSN